MPFCFVYTYINFPAVVVYSCACFVLAYLAHEGYKYCTLEQKMFYLLLVPSGAWSTATIEVTAMADIGHR